MLCSVTPAVESGALGGRGGGRWSGGRRGGMRRGASSSRNSQVVQQARALRHGAQGAATSMMAGRRQRRRSPCVSGIRQPLPRHVQCPAAGCAPLWPLTCHVHAFLLQGMPHKFYHGKTGRVWNVTKRAVGVELLKQVGAWVAAWTTAGLWG